MYREINFDKNLKDHVTTWGSRDQSRHIKKDVMSVIMVTEQMSQMTHRVHTAPSPEPQGPIVGWHEAKMTLRDMIGDRFFIFMTSSAPGNLVPIIICLV